MVKKFVVSLVLALACFLTAWADDIRPQSELVTVLNGKNADGKYVAEYENGVPVLKFQFVIPDDIDMSDFYCLCMRNYVAGTEANKGFCNLLHPEKNRRNLNENLDLCTNWFVNGDTVNFHTNVISAERSADKKTLDIVFSLKDRFGRFFWTPSMKEIGVRLPQFGMFHRGADKVKYLDKVYFDAAEYTFELSIPGVSISDKQLSSNVSVKEDEDLYLDNGATLVVDKDFKCNNIYVSAGDEDGDWRGAGIVINEGATLSADTVYYASNDLDDRSVGYLVNNGTYNAGSVFIKNCSYDSKPICSYARAYGYVNDKGSVIPKWKFDRPIFCSPVQETVGSIDLTYSGAKSPNFAGLFASGLESPFYTWNTSVTYMAYDWSEYYSVGKEYPFYLFSEYSAPNSVRVLGAVNDNDSYTLPVKNIAADGESAKTFVNNPYPAPIDWRSVTESVIESDGDSSFVNAIRDVQVSFVAHSIFSMYNLKTGITTFDAPNKMYYGYLQPNMSHSSLVHQNGERTEVTFSKKDLCSYAMADEKYADADLTNGLPYVRLYVDDVADNLSKGEGLRGVVALYFVPEQLNDSLHSAKCPDYDPNYDVNNVWETLSGWCFDPSARSAGYVFPYIGAYGEKQQYADKATAIKMVAIPADTSKTTKQYVLTESRLSDFIRISIEQKKTKGGVSFGILDGNLKDFGLGIRVGGLSYNYPELPDVLTSSIDVEDGFAEGENQKGFEAGKKFSDWDCKQISLDLSVARQYRTSTALDLVKKSASVVIKGGVGEVTLKASESGTLTLYDLSGRIVSETSMSSGSVSIRRGVYLASFKSDDGVSSAHVIVK
ncbi:MAG: T9SS type A sorting domain-containing protein [Marinilabiliaceae bacterium]